MKNPNKKSPIAYYLIIIYTLISILTHLGLVGEMLLRPLPVYDIGGGATMTIGQRGELTFPIFIISIFTTAIVILWVTFLYFFIKGEKKKSQIFGASSYGSIFLLTLFFLLMGRIKVNGYIFIQLSICLMIMFYLSGIKIFVDEHSNTIKQN